MDMLPPFPLALAEAAHADHPNPVEKAELERHKTEDHFADLERRTQGLRFDIDLLLNLYRRCYLLQQTEIFRLMAEAHKAPEDDDKRLEVAKTLHGFVKWQGRFGAQILRSAEGAAIISASSADSLVAVQHAQLTDDGRGV